ncbi:MAG: AEC family transporter [Deltaproteobacteria bacterium]|nr:AEC family transporter [Deltaproteobacteria bacterium]
MLSVVNTIIPIFAIVLLGCVLRSRGFLPVNLVGPLNQLVYYLAIPAMIFQGVAKAPFEAQFDFTLILATLTPVLMVFLIAAGAGQLLSVRRPFMATFIQSSFHGNIGYIGLAVCYYLLGEGGFTRASIVAAFLMLLQNVLAVFVLQLYAPKMESGRSVGFFLKKVVVNPVILSALSGIVFSLLHLPLYDPVDRALSILSGMALPLALLVIGASLSFGLIRSNWGMALGTGGLKLLILPGAGLFMYHAMQIPPAQFLPGLVLLATPTATVTYVMAGEMHGSRDLASAAVSMNTLLSALTFILWLSRFI